MITDEAYRRLAKDEDLQALILGLRDAYVDQLGSLDTAKEPDRVTDIARKIQLLLEIVQEIQNGHMAGIDRKTDERKRQSSSTDEPPSEHFI